MRAIWLVRTGLSPPGVPQRTMADFLSQFPEELGTGAGSGVSHCYVARARDAFAELLKELNGKELERLAATNLGTTPYFIQLIHDEASMRLRSTPVVQDASFALPQSVAVGSALFTRSRYSKIQNNCITIGMGEHRLEWLSEMQALGRKDGDTLGLALIAAVEGIMNTLARCAPGLCQSCASPHRRRGQYQRGRGQTPFRTLRPPLRRRCSISVDLVALRQPPRPIWWS
eukprot:3338133-Pyramimonas_sp.AAC.1